MRTRTWMLLVVVLALGACGGPEDPGPDASTPDSGPTDAGSLEDAAPLDAGPEVDGGRTRTAVPGPTMAVCPPTSTLTYENFGEAFFTSYCVRCHSSTLTTGAERSGATMGFDFDTLAGVEARASRIDTAAAAGPARVNIFMPLGTPRPSDAERDMLGEWIACGTP